MLSGQTAHPSPILPPSALQLLFSPFPSLFLLATHGSYRDSSFTRAIALAMVLSPNNSKINSNGLLLGETAHSETVRQGGFRY